MSGDPPFDRGSLKPMRKKLGISTHRAHRRKSRRRVWKDFIEQMERPCMVAHGNEVRKGIRHC